MASKCHIDMTVLLSEVLWAPTRNPGSPLSAIVPKVQCGFNEMLRARVLVRR